MGLLMKTLNELPYNTLTVYFAPYIFSRMEYAIVNGEFRLATNTNFFDDDGYLKKDITANQLLSQLYFITDIKSVYIFSLANNYADIFMTTEKYVVFKMNTFRFEFETHELVDMQNVLMLRTSALSRNAKRLVQQFWKNANKLEVLTKLADELYPTDEAKYRISKELGVDIHEIRKMTDLTEAIKKDTDSVHGILSQIDVMHNKEVGTE